MNRREFLRGFKRGTKKKGTGRSVSSAAGGRRRRPDGGFGGREARLVHFPPRIRADFPRKYSSQRAIAAPAKSPLLRHSSIPCPQ